MRLPGDELYLRAFHDLSTCREMGMALGPIPWRDILTYGMFRGLDNELLDHFIQVIREMDAGYLKWENERQKKQRESDEKQRKGDAKKGDNEVIGIG